jgi:FtsH-binding integral membrane protein
MENFSNTFGNSAAAALPEQRASFIRKTYMILAAAILAFIVVEGFLFASGAANLIANVVFSGGAMGWLLVLGLFMGVSMGDIRHVDPNSVSWPGLVYCR